MARKKQIRTKEEKDSFAQQVEEFLRYFEEEDESPTPNTIAVRRVGNVIYAADRFRRQTESTLEENLDWLPNSA